jgi:hypothetical protein
MRHLECPKFSGKFCQKTIDKVTKILENIRSAAVLGGTKNNIIKEYKFIGIDNDTISTSFSGY